MSLSDKGRRVSGSSHGPALVLRTSVPAKGATPSSVSAGINAIAPPPRVQLTSTSPSPEDQLSNGAQSIAAPRSRLSSNAPSMRLITISTASLSGAVESGREKDVRLALLERQLADIESEFQRQLAHLSQNESETATSWRSKHGDLNQQLLRTDTELRLLREELRAREAETEELTRAWRDAMHTEIAARDYEIRDLRAQVRGLKEWVSTSTRADDMASTSDEVFSEGMAKISNGLQNWVITNFRKSRVDLFKADEGTLRELGELVPTYEELARPAKVYLLQSIVSRLLVQRIFNLYFAGLSLKQEDQLRQTETIMASFGSVTATNHWRSVTLATLKKEAKEHMQAQTAKTVEGVVICINRILNAITTDTTNGDIVGPTMEARDQTLWQLVNDTVELSRLLVVQRAVFDVWMPNIVPHQQVLFDHATMEDMGCEDEENLAQREICCVTSPGIIKRGDETGAQLEYRNIISKARVLCRPE